MPVLFSFTLPILSNEQMTPLDYEVMGHAFALHSERGRLCDETVYQHDLAGRLSTAGMSAEIEVAIILSFRGLDITLKIDLLVEGKVVYELKTCECLTRRHEAQLLEYLFLTNSSRGKLINFRPHSVEARFVNSSRTTTERQQFTYDTSQYHGDSGLVDCVRELVSDWGTGLNPSRYRKAILHFAGDAPTSDCVLPMTGNGRSLGNQRFHLLDEHTALAVTTYSKTNTANRIEFEKVLTISPLRRMHWVNVTHGHLKLSTINNDRKI